VTLECDRHFQSDGHVKDKGEPMADKLSKDELCRLIRQVFPRLPNDRQLAVLVDLPDDKVTDSADWSERRAMAAEWANQLRNVKDTLGLDCVELERRL